MKRKVLVMILALLLCFSLSACGSYRANDGMNDNGTTNYGTNGTGTNGTGTDRTGGTYNGNGNNGTGSNGMNGNGMDDQTTDILPDAEDGYVDDNSGSDGILDGELSMPSPNVTSKR